MAKNNVRPWSPNAANLLSLVADPTDNSDVWLNSTASAANARRPSIPARWVARAAVLGWGARSMVI